MSQPWAAIVRGWEEMCVFIMFFISSADKATDPSVSEQDWTAIQNFCDQVNTDPSG